MLRFNYFSALVLSVALLSACGDSANKASDPPSQQQIQESTKCTWGADTWGSCNW